MSLEEENTIYHMEGRLSLMRNASFSHVSHRVWVWVLGPDDSPKGRVVLVHGLSMPSVSAKSSSHRPVLLILLS